MQTNSIILLTLLAILITWLCYKPALWIARKYTLFDKPEERKLHHDPVPDFGGVAVSAGIFLPLIVAAVFMHMQVLWIEVVVMAAMLAIGVADDLFDLPAWIRFVIELFLVWVLLWATHMVIEDLHGLWGREQLVSLYSGLPLSLIAGVGIINAVNMIDGVDGYSSGYGIVANTLFAAIFYLIGDPMPCLFSSIAAAALIPFYLHNVFGKKSKMFLGDGGSLLIGMVMVCDVFALLTRDSASRHMQEVGVGVVALALAVLCIPVFDTLRVMCARVLLKRSPFSADKTHLHHIFIRLGFSHVATSTIIICKNIAIVGLWYLSWRLGASIDLQFYIVVLLGLFSTCGFYYFTAYSAKKNNKYYQLMLRIGRWTHCENNRVWQAMQRIMDKL